MTDKTKTNTKNTANLKLKKKTIGNLKLKINQNENHTAKHFSI